MTTRTRYTFLVLWVLAASTAFYVWWQSGIPLTGLPAALKGLIEDAGAWGPAVYCLLFMVRGLTLAPASPFVLAAGLAWGPWEGMLWAWVGINLSGIVAYGVARAMGREWVAQHETPWMKTMEAKLLAAPMMTSMLLRFLLLPFDTVNYACGLVGVPLLPYAAGTALGVLPGVVTFAIFGGAWDDPRAIAVSALVFGGSIAFAAVLKKRGLVG
mgnify:CR=1 FL=1